MDIRGRVEHGMVVLQDGISLPEGTEVTVVVRAEKPHADQLAEVQRRKREAAIRRILAVPDENPGDTFSGADHDKVLYGKP